MTMQINKVNKIRKIKRHSFLSVINAFAMLLFIFSALLLSVQSAQAAYKAQGWNWYNTPYIDYSDDDEDEKPIQPVIQPVPISYSQQMLDFKKYYKEMQDKAVITQNVEDVAYAAQLRSWMMEQSKSYGRSMEKALMKYPSLSHELKFPTAQVARQVSYHEQQQKINEAIKLISQHFGLFYFYKGNNLYDQAMAPSVQELADMYGLVLIGFPVDGVALKSIKNNHVYSNQMQALGVKALPALFLVNPKTKQSIPLTYGFVAQDTVKDHFLKVVTDFGKNPLPQ
jgi:conjugal transfer pilus assembly protein TraF